MIAIAEKKRKTPVQVVNIIKNINDDVDFISTEVDEVSYTAVRGKKTYTRLPKTKGRKAVEIITTDNRERWKLIDDLYWYTILQLTPCLVEARSR